MKTALVKTCFVLAVAVVVSTTGCSKLFKKTVLPGPTPFPPNPPPQAACVQGSSAQSASRHPQAIVPAVLTMDSSPRGLQVEVNGGYLGPTPQSTTPPFSSTLNKVTILNGNRGVDFQVCFAQAANPNLTVFYNRGADTPGKITTIQSAARSPQNLDPSVVRRMPLVTSDHTPSYTQSVEVRYSGAAPRGLPAGTDMTFARSGINARVVRVAAGQSIDKTVQTLRAQPGVLSAEPGQLRFLKTQPPIATPNDPHFSTTEEWDMYTAGLLIAWSYTTGVPAVKVAIIDTGLDTTVANTMVQSDLVPKIDVAESVLTSPGTQGACTGTQTVTKSLAAIQDRDGHGTNVAGIATATGNNAAGFAGVAWNVKLQVYKIFDDAGNACTSDEAKAINDAVTNGARVINLSLGSSQSGGADDLERTAIENAIAAGVFVVAAAGNERDQGSQTLDFPAAYPGVMAVGASAINDNNTGNPAAAKEYVAKYSNAGPGLGIVAPGGDPSGGSDADVLHWISNLYSTTGNPPCRTPSNCYVLIAGTSQATPHVAGAAALLLSANPLLTPAQLTSTLNGTADDIGDANQGHGRLDVYRALAAVTGDASPPVYKPVNAQFVAFAYSNSGAANAAPTVLDITFPAGILVNPDGTFRVADIPTNASSFKIGVWYDANGNGVIDAGDRFAATGGCSQSGPCSGASTLSPSVIPAGNFTLP